MVKVVLLDRDGVINVELENYVKTSPEILVFPFSKPALDRLRAAGYLIYIVSNQSGVGRGLMTETNLAEVTEKLLSAVGPFDGVFYCTHGPDDGCDCRKPLPGLLMNALADAAAHGAVAEAWMVGDSTIDVAAGAAAGCRTIMVKPGLKRGHKDNRRDLYPDYAADDLAAAVDIILADDLVPRK